MALFDAWTKDGGRRKEGKTASLQTKKRVQRKNLNTSTTFVDDEEFPFVRAVKIEISDVKAKFVRENGASALGV
jgi:hypothetical protein